MKRLLVLLLLLLPLNAVSQVYSQQQVAGNGALFVRIINNTSYGVTCEIQDQVNYYSFIIYPGQAGRWYPIYGQWRWQCG